MHELRSCHLPPVVQGAHCSEPARPLPAEGFVSNVAVLGSTGSIGPSTLQVIAASAGRFRAVALSGHCNWSLLAEQSAHFGPQFVVATGREPDPTFLASLPPGTDVRLGSAALSEIARRPEVD